MAATIFATIAYESVNGKASNYKDHQMGYAALVIVMKDEIPCTCHDHHFTPERHTKGTKK